MTATALNGAKLRQLLPDIEILIREAGARVMEIYKSDFAVTRKGDSSPVTEADLAAEAIITPALPRLLPDIPVVGEEAVSGGRLPVVGTLPFWLVDPVDGTREFLKRNGEFTVNIALVVNRRTVLGAVLAPAQNILYTGIIGEGAWRREGDGPATPLKVRPVPRQDVTLVASRSHSSGEDLTQLPDGRSVGKILYSGSSLKFCLIAEGQADVYLRPGPTCEWDTAAAQAVLEAAGGRVTLQDGKTPLGYAKRADFLNPGFIAWGG